MKFALSFLSELSVRLAARPACQMLAADLAASGPICTRGFMRQPQKGRIAKNLQKNEKLNVGKGTYVHLAGSSTRAAPKRKSKDS